MSDTGPVHRDYAIGYLAETLGYTLTEAVNAVNGAPATGTSTYQLARHQVRWDYPGVYFITGAPDPHAAGCCHEPEGRETALAPGYEPGPGEYESWYPHLASGTASTEAGVLQVSARQDPGLAWIRQVIETVDAHLDANTAPAYRDQPLAGDLSRIGKAQSEAREAMEALAGVTGENPRKGICDTWEHVLEELGDTACAALLGIQHKTKDVNATWAVFLAALAKAYGRVPDGERPGPAAPICGTCGTRCGGVCPGPVVSWKGAREDEAEERR